MSQDSSDEEEPQARDGAAPDELERKLREKALRSMKRQETRDSDSSD